MASKDWITVDPFALPVVTSTSDAGAEIDSPDTSIVGRVVFVLTAEVNIPDSDNYCEHFDSITTVHATRSSAVHHLGEWLDRNGIDRDAAHYGVVRSMESWACDPDPDTLDGAVVHWGINRMVVQ